MEILVVVENVKQKSYILGVNQVQCFCYSQRVLLSITKEDDGFQQFDRSIKHYENPYTILRDAPRRMKSAHPSVMENTIRSDALKK